MPMSSENCGSTARESLGICTTCLLKYLGKYPTVPASYYLPKYTRVVRPYCSCDSITQSQRLECLGRFRDGLLHRQPLHARRAVKTMHALHPLQHITGVLGTGDGAAVAQHNHLGVDLGCFVAQLLDELDAIIKALAASRPNRSAGLCPLCVRYPYPSYVFWG